MPGMDADMVVFGENRIRDVNTFENPRVYPEGIDYVLVNGDRRRSRRPYGRASRQDHTRLTMPPTARPFPSRGRAAPLFFFKEETSMSYSPTPAPCSTAHARSVMSVLFLACAPCATADCIGSCGIGFRRPGHETVYPTTTGKTRSPRKVYPCRLFPIQHQRHPSGAMGAPLWTPIAPPSAIWGSNGRSALPVKLALPIILPALIKLNWPDYFGGAAMAGVNAVIGEGAVSKDPTLAYWCLRQGRPRPSESGKCWTPSTSMTGDTDRSSFRPTMTTTRRACRNTPSGNAGPRPSNSNSASPPRARSPRTSRPHARRGAEEMRTGFPCPARSAGSRRTGSLWPQGVPSLPRLRPSADLERRLSDRPHRATPRHGHDQRVFQDGGLRSRGSGACPPLASKAQVDMVAAFDWRAAAPATAPAR